MANDVRSDSSDRAARILDAAARLIAHYGYDKTTMSDIAHEAGVSKGALYLHWDSKEALFETLFEREVWRYSADWLARLDADPELWSYVGMFRHMMLALQANPLITALVRRDQRVLGSFLRTDSRLLQMKLAANTTVFSLMQDAGAVRDDIAPEMLAYLLSLFAVGLVNSSELIAPADTPGLEQAMDALGRLLDRGLAPADGSRREAGRAIIHQVVEQMRAQQTEQATSL